MVNVGTIKALWRYPVKGMAGESLHTSEITSQGLWGDRLWALRDTHRQEIQSCKYRPELLQCIANIRNVDGSHGPQAIDITLPDGTVVGADDEHIHALLSTLTGHTSTLERLRPSEDLDFYRRYKKDAHPWLDELKATFERAPGEPLPDLDHLPPTAQTFVSRPGTFFLVSPLHVVTTAKFAHLKQQAPESDWSIERFRPNIVIETSPQFKGLVEQDWIGRKIQINNIVIHCTGTTPRCGVITKPQQKVAQDTHILRTVVAKAEQNVGVYGETTHTGMISVGDEVFID